MSARDVFEDCMVEAKGKARGLQWWRGVVVSALSPINEANQHRARLLLDG